MVKHGPAQTLHEDSIFERLRRRSPTSSRIIGFLALLTAGGISLFLGGLTVTGVVITLVLLTPVFLFFSPILVPAGIALFLCVAGVVTAGGAAVAIVSILLWVYKYFKGQHPVGWEHFDHLRQWAIETAEHTQHRARELGGQAQSQLPGAAPGA